MDETKEALYMIPARYRKMENMHIGFWLVKDISWCIIWKGLGVAMIFPTLTIAIVIAWRTRNVKSELAHNLAIVFWIAANSYWMIAEFMNFDEVHVWKQFEGKHLALIPFIAGLLILLHYYIIQKPGEERASQVATM